MCKFGNQYEFLRQIKFFPNFSNPRKLIINVPIVPSFSDLEKPLTSCSRRYYCNNFSIPKPSNNTAEKKNGKKKSGNLWLDLYLWWCFVKKHNSNENLQQRGIFHASDFELFSWKFAIYIRSVHYSPENRMTYCCTIYINLFLAMQHLTCNYCGNIWETGCASNEHFDPECKLTW